MNNEYFVMEYPADNSKGYCTLENLEGFDNFYDVRQGFSLVDNRPSKLTMSMHADEPRNTVLPDYVENVKQLVIVSSRLKKFLEGQKVSHIEYYLLEIIDHKDKVVSDEYYIAHLIDPVECINIDESGAIWINEGLATQRIDSIDSLEIDSSRIPVGQNFFFPKHYSEYPIIHYDLAQAIEKEGFSNIEILPLAECAC